MKKLSSFLAIAGFIIICVTIFFSFAGIPLWVAIIGIILFIAAGIVSGIKPQARPIQYVRTPKTRIISTIGRQK